MHDGTAMLEASEALAAAYRVGLLLVLGTASVVLAPNLVLVNALFGLLAIGTLTYVWARPRTLPLSVRVVLMIADASLVGVWTAMYPEQPLVPVLFTLVVIGWTLVYGGTWGVAAATTSTLLFTTARVVHGDGAAAVVVSSAVLSLVLLSIVGTLAGLMYQVAHDAQRIQRERSRRDQDRERHLENVGRFASTVAHEMNNTLTAILGLASLMREDAPDSSPLYDDLEALELACRDGQTLVENLLGMTGQGELHIVEHDASELLPRLVQRLEKALPAGVVVHFEAGRALPPVDVDLAALARILLNVGANAVEAAQGEPLTLRITATAVAVEPEEEDGIDPGDWLRIDIEDDGPGLHTEDVAVAFSPVFSTKSRVAPTGLGLAHAEHVMGRHGGHARLRSQKNVGTVVTLWIPAAGSRPELSDAYIAMPSLPGAILLIEDDPIVQRAVVRQLQALGHDVVPVSDGPTALDAAARHAQGIRTIILDLGLPNSSGADLLEPLRRAVPMAHIVVSSGYLPESAQASLRRLGADGFLPKPYDTDQLSACLA